MSSRLRLILHRAKILFAGVIVFCALVLFGTFVAFLRTPLIPKEGKPITFIFNAGSSVVNLAAQLKGQKMLKYPNSYLVLLSIITDSSKYLHAGEYQIDPGMLPSQLLDNMVAGRVVWRNFPIIEGWTLSQIRAALDSNPYLLHKTTGLSEKGLAHLLNIPHDHLEGLFYPDTYRYTAGLTDVMILRKAYLAMQQQLMQAWNLRAPDLMYKNPYQALIVASMIEKEARLEADRPRIAGVILKRLKIGMPLQIDAAVIYGLGAAYDGHLKIAQLKIPSPYNTYLNKGLPPTPICMPGLASLTAALHPIINNDLFYVATGDGGHVFSATLAGQNSAIAKYRAVERKQVRTVKKEKK